MQECNCPFNVTSINTLKDFTLNRDKWLRIFRSIIVSQDWLYNEKLYWQKNNPDTIYNPLYKLYNISPKQSIEYQKISELYTNSIFEMYETPMNVALAVYVMRKCKAIITLCKTRNTIRRRSASPVMIVKKICLYMEREPCNRKALCFFSSSSEHSSSPWMSWM